MLTALIKAGCLICGLERSGGRFVNYLHLGWERCRSDVANVTCVFLVQDEVRSGYSKMQMLENDWRFSKLGG